MSNHLNICPFLSIFYSYGFSFSKSLFKQQGNDSCSEKSPSYGALYNLNFISFTVCCFIPFFLFHVFIIIIFNPKNVPKRTVIVHCLSLKSCRIISHAFLLSLGRRFPATPLGFGCAPQRSCKVLLGGWFEFCPLRVSSSLWPFPNISSQVCVCGASEYGGRYSIVMVFFCPGLLLIQESTSIIDSHSMLKT